MDGPRVRYFATHFYFCFYHTLSNMALRKVATTYHADWVRFVLIALERALAHSLKCRESS